MSASAAFSSPADAPTTSADAGHGYVNLRRMYDAPPERRWQIDVMARMIEFAKLKPNWDGYGAPPAKWDAGMFALSVLSQVMLNRTPMPQVVPSSVGGVQVEWHEKDMDIELHVVAPYAGELWIRDLRSGVEVSHEISDDFSDLQIALRTLTQR